MVSDEGGLYGIGTGWDQSMLPLRLRFPFDVGDLLHLSLSRSGAKDDFGYVWPSVSQI